MTRTLAAMTLLILTATAAWPQDDAAKDKARAKVSTDFSFAEGGGVPEPRPVPVPGPNPPAPAPSPTPTPPAPNPEGCPCAGSGKEVIQDGGNKRIVQCRCGENCPCKNKAKPKPKPRAVAAPARTRIVCITTRMGCSWCTEVDRNTIPALKDEGWSVTSDTTGQIQVLHALNASAAQRQYGVDSVPTWIVYQGDRQVRRHEGYLNAFGVGHLWDGSAITRADQTRFRYVPKAADPPTRTEPPRVGRREYRMRYGQRWGYEGPGDLAGHLMREHGYTAAQLSGLDHDSMMQLHGDWHEAKRRGLPRPNP